MSDPGSEDDVQTCRLFTIDGRSASFYLYPTLKPEKAQKARIRIEEYGGTIAKGRLEANVVLIPDEDDFEYSKGESLRMTRLRYAMADSRAIRDIHVEEVSFIKRSIQLQDFHPGQWPPQKGMGGRRPGVHYQIPIPFSDEDDHNLAMYLSSAIPHKSDGGRHGKNVYEEMRELGKPKDSEYKWARRHSAASWQNRYRNNEDTLDPLIARYVKTRRREDGNGTYSLKRKTPINRNRYSKRSRQAITSSPISEPDSEQHVDEERLRVPKDNVGSSSPEHPFLHRRGGRRTKKGKGKSLRREAMDDNEYTMLLNSSSRGLPEPSFKTPTIARLPGRSPVISTPSESQRNSLLGSSSTHTESLSPYAIENWEPPALSSQTIAEINGQSSTEDWQGGTHDGDIGRDVFTLSLPVISSPATPTVGSCTPATPSDKRLERAVKATFMHQQAAFQINPTQSYVPIESHRRAELQGTTTDFPSPGTRAYGWLSERSNTSFQATPNLKSSIGSLQMTPGRVFSQGMIDTPYRPPVGTRAREYYRE